MRFQKVYLEITNICNRSCAFCPGTSRTPRMMSEAEFRTVAERLHGWTSFLYFHLMGEPLLHPLLPRFLEIADELGFRVILTTNGTLLPAVQTVLLSASALHKVNISLHSFEANEGGTLTDYLAGCTDFAKNAAAQNITVSFRLWNEDGAQTVGLHSRNAEILAHLHGAFPTVWEDNPRGSKLSAHIYLNRGEKFDWPSVTAKDYGASVFCYGLKDQIGILCDGTAVPCCLDSDGTIPLGNLLTQSVREILDSPRTQAMIDGFRRRCAAEPLCRHCGYAQRFGSR